MEFDSYMAMTNKERNEKYKQTRLDWYQKNREMVLKEKKKYHELHKERLAAYKKEYYQKRKAELRKATIDYYTIPENRAKLLLSKAKERARKDNIEFNIELEDIVIPEYCPYLNIKLTHEFGKGQLESNSSIDRIDSSKGYIKGNIQIISRLANIMKSNADVETLLRFAHGVMKMHGCDNSTAEWYADQFLEMRK